MFLRYKASEKHRGSSYSGGRLCEEKGEKTDSLIEVKNVTKKRKKKKSLKEAKCAIGNSGRQAPVFKVARQAIAINNGRALIQKTMYARKKRRKHMGTAQ